MGCSGSHLGQAKNCSDHATGDGKAGAGRKEAKEKSSKEAETSAGSSDEEQTQDSNPGHKVVVYQVQPMCEHIPV